MVVSYITKLSTYHREPISHEQRLLLTLRRIATAECQIFLSLQFRIGRRAISKMVPVTCKAIYDALVANYVNTPLSQENWLAISKQFKDRWNLRRVVGALDGKHIRIINAFSVWFCSLCVVQSTASLCLMWVNTVATTTAACYSSVVLGLTSSQ